MMKDEGLYKYLYLGIIVTSFFMHLVVCKAFCYAYSVEINSVLGILICSWLSLWYTCMTIVYIHLSHFIDVLSETSIKDDIGLLLVLLLIYLIPPIYFLNVLQSHKVFIRLDHLLNEFKR